MLVYIAIRFEIRSGLTAVIGLCHDVLIMLSAYTILQIPINTSFIAAILTILGYSINAAIIVLDRVRENKKLLAAGNEEVVNISIKQCLMRTVNTTITTLFTIGMVCILGVTSIKEFTGPLIVGIVSGLYSSIFLTGPVWELLSKKKNKKK
jgi:preprotein translocase subunit SecF